MIHVVPQVCESELTIIIVGVHAFGDELAQSAVKEVDGLASELGTLVEHKDEPAEIEEHNADYYAVQPLHPDVLHCLNVGLQVGERGHKYKTGVNSLPNVFPYYLEVGLLIFWHRH